MAESNKKITTGKIVGFTFLGLFILMFFTVGSFLAGLAAGGFSSGVRAGSMTSSMDSIYLIRMEGVISGSASSGLLGGGSITPESIIEQLKAAEENTAVKAILIRVNSGGGSAAASQEIFEELKKVEKPVVVSVGDVCASGAFYISCAADKIVANRSSSVGSIGVIMQITNLEELYKKVGIKYTTIKQGKYKDVGSSDRPLTPEEEGLLEEQTFKIYDQFINDVAASRNLPVEKVKEIATGWVYLGTEAMELGLVDVLGTYKDAEKIAAELAGIKGEPRIINGQQLSLWDLLFNFSVRQVLSRITAIDQSLLYPQFK